MTIGYGISGIGYSPLGNMGLGATGTYGSYDAYLPSNMAINGMAGYGMGYGMGMMNPMMYGMSYMPYMMQMQNTAESMQLQHAGNMHSGVLNYEVNALRNTDSALVQKISTNGHIQQGIQSLAEKVREGDLEAACHHFDILRNHIFKTYNKELKQYGNGRDLAGIAAQYIEAVYANMVNANSPDGKVHSLRDDMRLYGEDAMKNGWKQGLKRGHSKMYVDEALNHCFGIPIEEKEHKDTVQAISKVGGGVGSALLKGGMGSVATVGATGLILGLGKLFSSVTPWKFSFMNTMGKVWKPAAVIGLGAGIIADIWWQISSSSKDNK